MQSTVPASATIKSTKFARPSSRLPTLTGVSSGGLRTATTALRRVKIARPVNVDCEQSPQNPCSFLSCPVLSVGKRSAPPQPNSTQPNARSRPRYGTNAVDQQAPTASMPQQNNTAFHRRAHMQKFRGPAPHASHKPRSRQPRARSGALVIAPRGLAPSSIARVRIGRQACGSVRRGQVAAWVGPELLPTKPSATTQRARSTHFSASGAPLEANTGSIANTGAGGARRLCEHGAVCAKEKTSNV
ncbi:hypothetical protein PSPO01_00559 [Paraphaeosphaeria sporulosa]